MGFPENSIVTETTKISPISFRTARSESNDERNLVLALVCFHAATLRLVSGTKRKHLFFLSHFLRWWIFSRSFASRFSFASNSFDRQKSIGRSWNIFNIHVHAFHFSYLSTLKFKFVQYALGVCVASELWLSVYKNLGKIGPRFESNNDIAFARDSLASRYGNCLSFVSFFKSANWSDFDTSFEMERDICMDCKFVRGKSLLGAWMKTNVDR